MIVDERRITLKAGDGGRGSISFWKVGRGPDGGNGGDGGSIIVEGSSDLTLLRQFHENEIVEAERGKDGGPTRKDGKNAPDLRIKMPLGSLITDTQTKEKFEIEKQGQEIHLCLGGRGGIGSYDQRSPENTTPEKAIPPGKGQVRKLHISLRFIADFGLIGLPSAGKSSLLNELTNTNVKTAGYHFTTLSPNLGVLPFSRKIVADIPGLIEGASDGKGLGIKFLKHIEKVTLLLHCISCASSTPLKDYETIRNELKNFDETLLKKEEIILLTKSDLAKENDIEKTIKKLKKIKREIVITSIHDWESIEKLKKRLNE